MRTYIFDYDDTLAWNMVDYSIVKIRFMDYVVDRLEEKAPDTLSILKILESIELKNVKTMGYSKERFPTSMRQAYRKICQDDGIVDEVGERKAYRIGEGVFDEKRWKERGLVEGAKETLEFLVSKGDHLQILTKGDDAIQRKKMKATGIERWFGDHIMVVPEKNPEVFATIINGFDKSQMYMVGNSEKSDILPAVICGVKSIYIPYETWAAEEVKKGLPNSPLITTYDKIIRIKENYDSH